MFRRVASSLSIIVAMTACSHVRGRAVIPVDCTKVASHPERIEEPGTPLRSDTPGTLPDEDVERVLYENSFRLHQCYLAGALRRDLQNGETARLRWTVAASGDVESLQVVDDGIGDGETLACIAQCAASWRFQRPYGGTAVIERDIPFALYDRPLFRPQPHDNEPVLDDDAVHDRMRTCIEPVQASIQPLSDAWIVVRVEDEHIREARVVKDGTRVPGFAVCLANALVSANGPSQLRGAYALLRLYVRRSGDSGVVSVRP